MQILVIIKQNDGFVVEEAAFTNDPNQDVSETNALTLPSLLLLIIRYLSSIGPY